MTTMSVSFAAGSIMRMVATVLTLTFVVVKTQHQATLGVMEAMGVIPLDVDSTWVLRGRSVPSQASEGSLQASSPWIIKAIPSYAITITIYEFRKSFLKTLNQDQHLGHSKGKEARTPISPMDGERGEEGLNQVPFPRP